MKPDEAWLIWTFSSMKIKNKKICPKNVHTLILIVTLVSHLRNVRVTIFISLSFPLFCFWIQEKHVLHEPKKNLNLHHGPSPIHEIYATCPLRGLWCVDVFRTNFFRVFQKKISFSRYVFSTFQTILSHLRPIFGEVFLKNFTANFFFNFGWVQSDARACSSLFFFETESNNCARNADLQCPLDVVHALTKIWMNIWLFHGESKAQKCRKSSNIITHFSKKITSSGWRLLVFMIYFLWNGMQ